MSDETEADALRQRVEDLSRDAFTLAREAAELDARRRKLAEDLDRSLDELIEPIQSLAAEDRPAIVEAWNDARLDVAWVLAGGAGPTSLRLGGWLTSEGRSPDEGGSPDEG